MSAQKSPLVKFYLFSYNYIEAIGWAILLLQLVKYYIYPADHTSLYDSVKWSLIFFQNAAVLEILHALTGIVSSSAFVTAQQVISRVVLVCGVIMPTVAGRMSIGLPLALFAWSTTEIVRYTFYALNLIKSVPQFIVWLRYTTFIFLYPIGVTGELLCLYAAQNEVADTGLWTIVLPNFLNISFRYQYFLIFFMLSYIPFFPQLYMHMIRQRKKILGQSDVEAVHKQKVN